MAYEGILGAVFGDIIGSRFEFNNIKSKEFEKLTNLVQEIDKAIEKKIGKND